MKENVYFGDVTEHTLRIQSMWLYRRFSQTSKNMTVTVQYFPAVIMLRYLPNAFFFLRQVKRFVLPKLSTSFSRKCETSLMIHKEKAATYDFRDL